MVVVTVGSKIPPKSKKLATANLLKCSSCLLALYICNDFRPQLECTCLTSRQAETKGKGVLPLCYYSAETKAIKSLYNNTNRV